MLQAAPSSSETEAPSTLPELPSSQIASRLMEAAYLYTQARYCVLDWIQIREWHQKREDICFAGTRDDIETQISMLSMTVLSRI